MKSFNLSKSLFYTILILSFLGCTKKQAKENIIIPKIEAVTLLGDTLFSPEIKPSPAYDQFLKAKSAYDKNPDNVDSLIWFGRRTAYLGKYRDAIDIYSEGIKKHPEDARLYRHRGHRYISTRQYDKAIADFEKAVLLIEDKEDQVEPDGLPNSRNIPLSTLHGNIWYHLGLAYYLQGDMTNALRAYSNRTVTEKYPDNIVSGGHWLYMINKRIGNTDEANKVVSKVEKDMDIIENMSYHTMCLFYKGLITEEEIGIDKIGTSSSDVLSYGLANWYLYEKQDPIRAEEIYKRLLHKGNKFSFAYLAAESDWKRLYTNKD